MNLSLFVIILHISLVFCQEEWKEVSDKASGPKFWLDIKTGATTQLNSINPSLSIIIYILSLLIKKSFFLHN